MVWKDQSWISRTQRVAEWPFREVSTTQKRNGMTLDDVGLVAGRPVKPAWRWSVTVTWMVLVLAAVSVLGTLGLLSSGRVVTAPASSDVGSVQAAYSGDLLARINAERAARNSSAQPVPPLIMDAGLNAAAEAQSNHIASMGVVQDPPLTGCGPAPAPNQMCVLAGNAGISGNGFWPGDGSDGMENQYMASAGHRQNMLNAGYDTVGVGVTCSGGQAWTVELFGFVYGTIAPALSRQAAQNSVAGNPVPAGPEVAGTQTGAPLYCPGQTTGPNGAVTLTGGRYPYPFSVPGVPGEQLSTAPLSDSFVGIAASTGDAGYWVATASGKVSAHGSAGSYGSMAGIPLAKSITNIVGTSDGKGYWLVASDGGIFAFGDATYHGSTGGLALNAPVVGMAPTPDGNGYWLVASDGGIFAFGDATYHGSMGGQTLNAPVVGIARDPSGSGYWLVASDGGVFAFGDALFRASAGRVTLTAPVVGMARDPSGSGYWLVGSDGGIFAFGGAPFRGSAGGLRLAAPVTEMVPDQASGGYWLVGSDGGVFAFAAPFFGAA